MAHDLFISYRRSDFAAVKPMTDELESRGFSCWMDVDRIESGDENFKRRIVPALDRCKIVLFFISSAAQKSEWTAKELGYANRHNKRIIPVRFNEDQLVGEYDFDFGGADIVDWREREQRGKLFRDLAKWLGGPEPESLPAITCLGVLDPPRKRRGVLWTAVVLLVAVAAFAALRLIGARDGGGETAGLPPPGMGEDGETSPPGGETDIPPAEGPDAAQEPAPALPEFGERWAVALPDGAEMSFVPCPAGLFRMGSPEGEPGRFPKETLHFARISSPFWIGETEVTQQQWEMLMGTTLLDLTQLAYEDETPIEVGGRTGTNRFFNWVEVTGEIGRLCGDPDGKTAMYNVSWDDATNFCSRLTERERAAGRLPDGYVYRLPTEAEWEYAARAGSRASLPDGTDLDIQGENNAPNLDSQAWYAGNSSEGFSGTGLDTSTWGQKQYPGGFAHVRRVREKSPNAWGVYDAIGNVFEWCFDRWDFSDYPPGLSVDPRGPESGTRRCLRGGSWMSSPVGTCRLANRRGGWPNRRVVDCGFRVALAPELD